MKEKLMKLLAQKEEKRATLVTKSEKSEDVNELRSINAELGTLNMEIEELRGMVATAEAAEAGTIPEEARTAAVNGQQTQEQRKFVPGVGFKAMASSAAAGEQRSETDDKYGTLEYRKAFMDYCKTGAMVPELRADAMTTASDVSAIIPTTILNEVIRKVTTYGQIYSRTRKLSIKGGVSVPIISLKPVATWIGETPTSDKQKVQSNTKVTFSYYGLECKVSTSLLADTVSLAGFETIIIDLIVEAMVIAIETAIVKGDGTNKALGITVDTRVPASQIVTMTAAEFKEWSAWKKKVFAKMPLSYKAGAAFYMASGTFEGYIDGMVDANGQPIGRVNYGITEGMQERFGGKEVIQVEDNIISNYDDAATGDVVAIYCNLSNYATNSNMQMTMFRYFDHDTNEYIDKAILIMDGKLLDPNGVVIVKKGA